jgi:transposase
LPDVTSPSPIPLSEAKQIVELQRKLAWAELKIQVLEERLRLERIKKYGPGSEKLSDAQLQLLDLEPSASNAEVQAESQREPLPAPEKQQQRRKHPGRQELPAGLARVERVIACTPEQCTCKACGQAKAVIGYDVSEQLDVEPAQYFVMVTKREKRACKHCEEGGVVAARVPERIIEKSLVSDRVVIDTLVAKYSDHLPLYRQSAILEREAGVEIGRATLDGWVMRVGELLIPLVDVMRRELLGGSYIQADETPVDVQLRDGRGQNHQAYLWQYSQPGGGVVFDFCLGRGREGPKKFLGQFEGILQTDGYVAYDRVGGPKLVHAGCWAHSRRKFFDAVTLNLNDAVATRIVKRIDELFGIDAAAREEKLDHAARHVLRLERAKPLVETIRGEVEAARDACLPSSALGKAAHYTLSQWKKLTRFLEHAELELSNNLAENSMRPVALGRKNWIHVGSQKAGPKVAAILSIVETCRRMKIPIRAYLAAVLPGIADVSIQRLVGLTPAAWAARQQ